MKYKKKIKDIDKINLSISTEQAYKIGEFLYEGLRKRKFGNTTLLAGDSVEFMIENTLGEECCKFKINFTH